MSIAVGQDLSMVDTTVAELEDSIRQTPRGASVRIKVRGEGVHPAMAVAVMKLLERHPKALVAVKWQAPNGLDLSPGHAGVGIVTVMRKGDLFASYDATSREVMQEHGHILTADNASDLDPELEGPFAEEIRPRIEITGE